jgi:hypothetical protein
MRFRLRTLMIVLAILPPMASGVSFVATKAITQWHARQELNRLRAICGMKPIPWWSKTPQ